MIQVIPQKAKAETDIPKGLSIGVWAVSLQSLHISSHLFHHLLGPSVLF